MREYRFRPGEVHTGQDVERMAREQAEAELQEREPNNASELIEATLSALEQLRNELAYNPEAAAILTQIEQRVRRFTIEEDEDEEESSQYLENRFTQPNEQTQQIDRYLVAELNPLLADLRDAIRGEHDDVRTIPAAAQDLYTQLEDETVEPLIARLRYGQQDDQRVATLFASVDGFTCEREHMQQKLVVRDPISKDEMAYWESRLNERSGDTTPEQVIAGRSFTAAYEIDQLMVLAEARDDEKLAEACAVLSEWLHTTGEQMEQSFQQTTRNFDFAHGDLAQVFAIMNAAEMIKHREPMLYARLLGVSPGSDQHTEVERSDLYGNALHIAVAHSLRYRLGTGVSSEAIPAASILKERVRKMTVMDATSIPLFLGEQEMQDIGAMKKRIKEDMATSGDPFRAVKALRQGVSQEMYLAELLHSVDLAERDKRVEDLRVASPSEFLAMVRGLSEDALEDPHIHGVVAQRLKITDDELNERGLKQHLLHRISEHSKNRRRQIHGKSVAIGLALDLQTQQFGKNSPEAMALQMMLWETMPKEAILSEAFFIDIVEASKRAPEEPSEDNEAHWLGESVLYAAAHADITDAEWEQWFQQMVEHSGNRSWGDRLLRRDAVHTRNVLLQVLLDSPPTLIERVGPSRFGTVAQQLGDLRNYIGSTLNVEVYREAAMTVYEGMFAGYDNKIRFFHVNANTYEYEMGRQGRYVQAKKKLPEHELLIDPARRAVLEFRTRPIEEFANRFLDILEGIGGYVLTDQHLDAFFNTVSEDERIQLLERMFQVIVSDKKKKMVFFQNSFAPHNPWQVRLLEYGKQDIAENEGFQYVASTFSGRASSTTLMPKNPGQYDGYVVRSEPQWGQPRVDEASREIEFRTASGKTRTYPFAYSQPRFVEGENGRFHPEAWDEATEQWERIPMYDRFDVLETREVDLLRAQHILGQRDDGQMVTYDDFKISIWDPTAPQSQIRSFSVGERIGAADMHGNEVVVGSENGHLYLVDPSTSEHIAELPVHTRIGRNDLGSVEHVKMQGDQMVVVRRHEGSYSTIERRTCEQEGSEEGTRGAHISSVEIVKDGTIFFVSGERVHSMRPDSTSGRDNGWHAGVKGMVANDQYLAISVMKGAGDERRVIVYDQESMEIVQTFPSLGFEGNAGLITRDNKLVLRDSHQLSIYDISSGELDATIETVDMPHSIEQAQDGTIYAATKKAGSAAQGGKVITIGEK